jgi:arylsulfatase A-like enzyme
MMKSSVLLIAATLPAYTAAATAADAGRFNVLMIAVDDLRPTFGCYGHPEIKTPNLDALAAGGTLFERAYVMQAVCSPSRTCLLTGRRPDTTKVYDLQTHFRKTIPDVVTLPQHFKNHGYHTQAFGKIYHSSLDDPASWSAPTFDPRNSPEIRNDKKPLPKGPVNKATGRGPAWDAPDVADDQLGDGVSASRAVALLNELKDKRFFLAVGFYKPHLPFVAPKKYFDLYPPDTIRLPANMYPPKNVTEYSLTSFGELRSYADTPEKGPVSDEQARELIRAYYAASSYTDAQIGRILDELTSLGLDEKTVVCVWGDHGWKLGEHGGWCKHTNFEIDVNAPLIFRVPSQLRPGTKTRALAEFVDVYPTLAELCGLPTPEGVEGVSLVPVIADPDRSWKEAAFSQYPRGNIMGYSMKTDRYRYTEWQDKSGKAVARELYDHETDPDENENVAAAETNRELVAKLREQLNAGWKTALPK